MTPKIDCLPNLLHAVKVILALLFTTITFTSFAQLTSTTTQTISTNQTYTGSSSITNGTVTIAAGTTATFNGSITVGTGGSLVIQNGARIIVNGVMTIGTSNTGSVVVQNGGSLTVGAGSTGGTAAISVNSTSATALDVQTGGAVIVKAANSGNAILGLYETNASNINITGSLQIRGGGFKMDGTSKLTYSGTGNDTIVGNPNAAAAYFSNSTVLTVGSGVNLYINGDTKNDSNANFAINGNVSINGNYQSGNNTANVTGTGTLNTTGSLDADSYQGSVFGQHYSCATGPCAGNNLIASGNTNTCNGGVVAITGVAYGGATYQWLVSTTSATSGFSTISGATSQNYTTTGSSSVQYSYYKRQYTLSGQTYNSNTLTITSSYWQASSTVPAIGGTSSVCAGSTITLTNSLSGGTWSSSNTGIATVSSAGVVTGISGGTAVITYAGPSSGCYTASAKTITVLDVPGVMTISSTGTYTVPANVKSVSIQIWGAGGSGSKGYTNLKGTGGGGGGYAQKTIAVTAGDVISVTVGTGGAGATSFGNGNDGGTSSATVDGSTISATGGLAGVSINTPSGTGGLGGSGVNGSYNYSGGGGSNITFPGQSNPGGGGGGSAGTGSNGNNAGNTTPGSGTSGATAVAGGGAGGSGSSAANGDGAAGGFPGGGGGGNAGTGNGGNGANGVIVITAYTTKIAYSAASFCKTVTSALPTVTGVSGGTYSSTSGLTINSTTGEINPGTSTAGNYTVSYSNTCGVISSTFVGISAAPTASAGGSQTICQSGTATVSGASSSNGTISWTSNRFGSITSGATTLTPTYTSVTADAGTTVTLTMTVSNGVCTNATATYTVTVGACTNTWTGALSTAWNTTGNWSLAAVPIIQNDVVIPNVTNKPVIAAGVTATTATITIAPGSSVTLTGTGSMNVYGSLTNNGTFTPSSASGSVVSFKGSSAQTISGVAILYNATVNNIAGVTIARGIELTMKGALMLTAGALNTNGNLTIDIDNGGNIGYTTGDVGTVSGNVKVFRAINSITTHYISCPLNGVTANDLADDAQVINPATTKTRLFQFNNTSYAWTAVDDLNTVMAPSNSYSMWFPAVTSVDFTGTYNHAASYTYSSPNVAAKFMFVSNPYPSTLDWEASSGWTKTGVKNAVYFWNPTTNGYASYVSGQGTNSATQYIPAMNSFFVAYNGTTPSTATVGISNGVRSTTYKAMWRTKSDETVRLTLKSANAADEAVIRFNDGATNDFDDALDAYKMMNASAVPSIYTAIGSTNYSINSISSPYAKDTIPVMIKVPADGDYVLSINSSDPTIEYILADKKLGTETPVTTKDYSFTALKTDSINRFDLQMRQAESITTGVQQASLISGLQILSSPNGFLVKSGVSGTGSIEIMDATGNRVKTLSNVSLTNGNNFFTPEIAGGLYLVKVNIDNMSYIDQVSIVK